MKLYWRLSTLLIVALSVTLIGCPVQKGNSASFDSTFGLLLPGTPQIGSVTPPSGPDSGGITVTVNGSGFRNGVTVLFGGAPATNIVVLGFDKIQCTIPPGKVGFVDVSVANVDGNFFILKNGFEYVHFEVDPNHGDPNLNTLVTVRGSGFKTGVKTSILQILFGTKPGIQPSAAPALGVDALSATELQVLTPNNGGVEEVVDVTLVYANGNRVVLPKAFSFTAWSFETPDAAATDIKKMASFVDGTGETLAIAVGYRGMVNIKNNTKDWAYTTLKNSSGQDLYDDTTIGYLKRINPTTGAIGPIGNLPDFLGVWIGASTNEVVAIIVGEKETILMATYALPITWATIDWTQNWVVINQPQANSTIEFNDVHGLPTGATFNVYIAGDQGKIVRAVGTPGTGTPGTMFPTITPKVPLISVSGVTNNLFGVCVITDTEILFCGSSGKVVHCNGTVSPTFKLIDVNAGDNNFDPVYSVPTFYDIVAVENKDTIKFPGAKKIYLVGSPSYPNAASWAYYSTILQGGGDSGNYTKWERMSLGTVSKSNSTLYGVYAASDGNAYASGSSSSLLRLEGTMQLPEWNIMPYGSKYQHPSVSTTWTYYGITGYTDTSSVIQQLWVGGSKGRIMHHSPPASLVGLSALNRPHMWFTESTGSANTINDIHANAWNNVWAVGENGTVYQGENDAPPNTNMIKWSSRTNGMPVTAKLNGVWTAGPGQTWACGSDGTTGVIYYWDGAKWHDPLKPNPSRFCKAFSGTVFRDIYGFAPQAVWAVGDAGTIYKWDGVSWQKDGMTTATPSVPITTENLRGVFASQSSSGFTKIVVAVGDKGTGVVLTGGTWVAATTGTTENLYGIHGATPYSMYAVGDNGTVLAFSSYGNWTQAALPSGTTTANYRSILYNDVDDIIACGDNGTMVAYRGTPVGAWITLRSPTAATINSIFAVDANETFLSDGTGTLYRGHSHWVTQVVRTLTIRNYNYALFAPNGDIWVVASDGSSARKNNNKWARIDTGVGSALYCIWANNSTDLYTVGSSGKILNYTGGVGWSLPMNLTSTSLPPTSTLFWVWGISGSPNVFVTGANGTLLKLNSGTWDEHTSGGSTYDWITWVGGTDINNVWATGDYTLSKYGGTATWANSTASPTLNNWLVQNWVAPSGNIYAVGYSGQIAVYNKVADQWTSYYYSSGTSPTSSTLWKVWGIDDNNVWAVGNSGTIVHWNGSWSVQTTPTTNTLYGVCVGDGKNPGEYFVYACGRDGTLLKYDTANTAAGWKQEAISTDQNFFYVTCKGVRVVVTSEFGTVLVK